MVWDPLCCEALASVLLVVTVGADAVPNRNGESNGPTSGFAHLTSGSKLESKGGGSTALGLALRFACESGCTWVGPLLSAFRLVVDHATELQVTERLCWFG